MSNCKPVDKVEGLWPEQQYSVATKNELASANAALGVSDTPTILPCHDASPVGCTDYSKLDSAKPAVPCGLIAKSFFNDTYQWCKAANIGDCTGDELIDINEKGIAWDSDVQFRFKNLEAD